LIRTEGEKPTEQSKAHHKKLKKTSPRDPQGKKENEKFLEWDYDGSRRMLEGAGLMKHSKWGVKGKVVVGGFSEVKNRHHVGGRRGGEEVPCTVTRSPLKITKGTVLLGVKGRVRVLNERSSGIRQGEYGFVNILAGV